MKRTISSFTVCLSALLFVITGCSDKNDGTDPQPKTKSQLIAQGTWRFANATWGGANMTPLLQNCWKDNTMLFVVVSSGTGTGTFDEGATLCNVGDPQTRPFNWLFLTSETVLSVDTPILPGGTGNFDIVTLTSAELTLKQPYTMSGTTKDAVVTFTH